MNKSAAPAPIQAIHVPTDRILATLGHEIRNPLSALSHALHLCRTNRQTPGQIQKLYAVMERQLDQIKRLSGELLDSDALNPGNFEIRREPVELQRIIDYACEQIRPIIDKSHLNLAITVPVDPIYAYGDASRLLQVFANLLQNAAKFTNSNGNLELTLEQQAGLAVVRVRDDGLGIDAHRLSAIFTECTRADGARAHAQAGLAIGLGLVKSIVELHGGSVTAKSEGRGLGSEFAVRLPIMKDLLVEPTPSRPPGDERDVSRLRRPLAHRILVMDDDRTAAELLSRMLRPIAHKVTTVTNGEAALHAVLKERPQVVFLDMMMRGIDGCEVARRLRRETTLAGIVLIALSGNADESSKHLAMEAGCDRYLVKPVSMAELVEVLANVPVPFGSATAFTTPIGSHRRNFHRKASTGEHQTTAQSADAASMEAEHTR